MYSHAVQAKPSSAEILLKQAVLWLDPRYSTAGEQVAVNRGTAGVTLNGQYGSTGSVDTNDPTLLPWNSENYLHIPTSSASNNAAIPDSPALDITGDIEVVIRVSIPDWTPSAATSFVRRTNFADPNIAWDLAVLTNGRPRFSFNPLGTAASVLFGDAGAIPSFADGQTYWLKFTLDVDNGSSGRTHEWLWAADQATEPSSWTSLGGPQVTAGVTNLPNVTAPLYMGASSTIQPTNFYRVIVRNGIAGSSVADINFSANALQSSFTCSTGQTVTINRATTGKKTVMVTRPCWLFGGDDYISVPDNDLLDFTQTDPFSVLAVVRRWGTPAAAESYVGKTGGLSGGTFPGWYIGAQGTGNNNVCIRVKDGTVTSLTTQNNIYTPGDLILVTGVSTATTLVSYKSNTASTPATKTVTATLANSNSLAIGSLSGNAPGLYADAEILGAAVFRRSLSAAEVASLVSYYGTV